MSPKIYIFDPTAEDALSRVRGVGRYMQMLRENLGEKYTFTSALHSIPYESVFINPFYNFLQPPLAVRKVGRTQIAIIHDLIPLKYPSHFPLGIRGTINVQLNKWLLSGYQQIISNSETTKQDIVSILGIAEEKITTLYPVVAKIFSDADKKPTTNYQLPTTDYSIYVGDATWNKNLVNLARAIQIADIHCVFVGKVFSGADPQMRNHPWQKELKEFLELTKNDSRFVFPGFIPDEVLVDLYKNSLCNILVSRDEGFGFSYLESAVLGVPSILSTIPALHETAVDSALFASPDNPQEIATQIQKFKSDTEIRKQYGAVAQKRAKFFTAERFHNAFESLLQ